MKKAVSLVLALAIGFSCATASFAQANQAAITQTKPDPSTIYNQSVPAVVLINCMNAAGEGSQGSGIILRADGVIATNFHVISDAVSARVRLSSGDIYDDVLVVDTDERKDIAILKIKAMNLPVLIAADSETVKIGATVFAIGAPHGLSGSLSSGLVSSLRLASELSPSLNGFRFIQFTAPVSPGSSGGPLIDDSGKFVGLVALARVDSQNINLAIPSNYVMPMVTSAKPEGRKLGRIPDLATSETTRNASTGTINDLAGTYTGTWASDEYGVYGSLVMTVSVVDNQVQARVALTGSDYIK